jgi:outer membrane lipoprotein-sorting protein
MCGRIKLIVLLGLLALLLGGCGHHDVFPKASVDRIDKFSLDSLRVEKFKKDPSAAELYAAMMKLYDSLQSVAASAESDILPSDLWSINDKGDFTIDKEPFSVPKLDYRYAGPDKRLVKMEGQIPTVRVDNGKTVIVVYPEAKCYRNLTVPFAEKHAIADILGLTPASSSQDEGMTQRSIETLTRRPDETVDGEKVYVLDVRLAVLARAGQPSLPAEIRRFFVGKDDLLPRKILITQVPLFSNQPNEHQNLTRVIFQGFECNAKLSDDLFTKDPPSGFKLVTTAPKPPAPPADQD